MHFFFARARAGRMAFAARALALALALALVAGEGLSEAELGACLRALTGADALPTKLGPASFLQVPFLPSPHSDATVGSSTA